jgi:ABC-type sugar transport system, permease component
MSKKLKMLMREVLVVILGAPFIFPIYMLVVNSFKNKMEAADMGVGFPVKWHIYTNYAELIKSGNILIGFKNSLILSVVPIIFIIAIISMASFILQRRKQKVSEWIYCLFVIGMILPGLTVPTVLNMHFLHIPGYLSVVLIYIASGIPMGTILYVGYYKSIPREIDESAVIDGCGLLKMFWQIIFPLVSPITTTFSIITFLYLWNEFEIPLYFISGHGNQTIMVTLYCFTGPHASDWNLVSACIVVITLPVVILYAAIQKKITTGMASILDKK